MINCLSPLKDLSYDPCFSTGRWRGKQAKMWESIVGVPVSYVFWIRSCWSDCNWNTFHNLILSNDQNKNQNVFQPYMDAGVPGIHTRILQDRRTTSLENTVIPGKKKKKVNWLKLYILRCHWGQSIHLDKMFLTGNS